MKNNVKIRQVYICINTVNTIGLNFIKGILMACNLTDLKMLTIVGPRIVPKSDIEKKFIERNLAMGLPSSLMDDWYPIHHVIVENANDIEHLDIPITEETFHWSVSATTISMKKLRKQLRICQILNTSV